MTVVMFVLANLIRTPIALWVTAMACDTFMVVAFMVIRATVSHM